MKQRREFDFVGKRKIFFAISSLLILGTIVFAFIFGVELDIGFKGGAIITYSYTGDIDNAKVEALTEKTIGYKVTLQNSENSATKENNLVISLAEPKGLTSDQQVGLTDALQKEFKDHNIKMSTINNVNPTIGKEFFIKSLVAVAFASILIIIYVAIRFKKIGGWSAGVMAVVALIHDVLMVFGTFVIFRIPLDDNFMAVVLTILGYSVNDTIVIYDRIRENKTIQGNKWDVGTLVNKSVNQTLTRSINTSVATILAMTCVCVVTFAFGVTSILSFALPLVIGMISGVYSTIFIAGPLWVVWKTRKKKV
jgi:preprotein translocase SecF subunit